LFNKNKFKKLLERREWDHKINLLEDVPKELNAKAYAIMVEKDEALNQWLEKQLKIRLIVELSSRYITLCFYIPKKDKSLQLVQDYRKLNQHTIKDKIPLSLIEEVIKKLDLIWEYNNVQIKEENK